MPPAASAEKAEEAAASDLEAATVASAAEETEPAGSPAEVEYLKEREFPPPKKKRRKKKEGTRRLKKRQPDGSSGASCEKSRDSGKLRLQKRSKTTRWKTRLQPVPAAGSPAGRPAA